MTERFTLDDARLCAALALDAYRPFERDGAALAALRDSLHARGGALLATFDQHGTQAILVAIGDRRVLVFRGTELNGRDILTDIDARMMAGGTHRGFTRAWTRVAESVADVLDTLRPDWPLLVAGHSLGGALAVLAGRDLAARDIPVAAVYSFGAPRLGRSEVAAWRPDAPPFYRVAVAGDPVPWVPFLAMGFRHVGQLYYIDPLHRLRTSPSSFVQIGHMLRWLSHALRRRRSPFRAHAVRHYGSELDRCASSTARPTAANR